MANQAALENNPVAIESAAFYFSVNCSLNNFHTLHKELLVSFHEIRSLFH